MSLEAAYFLPHPPLAVPDVGQGQEERIADTIAALEKVSQRIAQHEPDILVVISPHSAYYSDWIYIATGSQARGSLASFGAPQMRFALNYDDTFRNALIAEARMHNIAVGEVTRISKDLDHGIMVPLYFIEKNLAPGSYRAVSIGGSGLEPEVLLNFGSCIADVSETASDKVVLIVSGDLSHKLTLGGPYGFDPAGPAFDNLFKEIIEQNKLLEFAEIDPSLREDAAECGLSGFIMCAGALDKLNKTHVAEFDSELLSLEGPYGVGYGVVAFEKRKV